MKPVDVIKKGILFFRRHLFRIMIITLVLCLMLLLKLYIDIRDKIQLICPEQTVLFEDRHGNYISEETSDRESSKGFWKIDRGIPDKIKQAFLVIEDRRFYQHSGVDIKAILRALKRNLFGGRREGASTIAMQVARMQNPGPRTYWKKFKEICIASLLIRKYGHEKILKQYLQLVPQGNQIHGISYAARRYFKKPIKDLGWTEAALLAALPKAPGKMNLFSSRGLLNAKKRAMRILRLLHHYQKINRSQLKRTLTQLREMTIPYKEDRPHHSFHLILRYQELIRQHKKNSFRKPVRTCLDSRIQSFVSDLCYHAMRYQRPRGAGNIAVIVVEKNNGSVRAYKGSEYYFDPDHAGSINYARTPRSSGSTLKPFIFGLGMAKNHYNGASILPDLPFYITHKKGDYSIRNYDDSFLGPMIYRRALANSRNIPAVIVLKKNGLFDSARLLKRLGFKSSLNSPAYYGLGMAVGGYYVTLEELITAYGVLANDGRPYALKWFEKGTKKSGNKPPVRPVLPTDVCRKITHYLSDPMARLPSFSRLGPMEFPFPVAVKTGTSHGHRDAWAIGWSHRYLIGVWMGHPNNDRMKKVSGQSSAHLLKRIMLFLHPENRRGIKEIPFSKPENHALVRLCPLSGHLATEYCPTATLEYLKEGSAMEHPECMTHRRFAIDRSTGELAEKTTPKDRIEYRVFTILPPIYAKWGIRQGFEPPPIQRKNKVNMASISILEPNHGSRILIDPETPLSFQTIPLKAKVYPPIEKIVWWIDGEKKTVAYPYEMRFQLKPGIHRIQASFPNAEVKSPLISIHVL